MWWRQKITRLSSIDNDAFMSRSIHLPCMKQKSSLCVVCVCDRELSLLLCNPLDFCCEVCRWWPNLQVLSDRHSQFLDQGAPSHSWRHLLLHDCCLINTSVTSHHKFCHAEYQWLLKPRAQWLECAPEVGFARTLFLRVLCISDFSVLLNRKEEENRECEKRWLQAVLKVAVEVNDSNRLAMLHVGLWGIGFLSGWGLLLTGLHCLVEQICPSISPASWWTILTEVILMIQKAQLYNRELKSSLASHSDSRSPLVEQSDFVRSIEN